MPMNTANAIRKRNFAKVNSPNNYDPIAEKIRLGIIKLEPAEDEQKPKPKRFKALRMRAENDNSSV